MTDTGDKVASSKERFDATCVAHGLTPEDVRRIGFSPGGQAILHGFIKEAGITKEEHDAGLNHMFPKVDALPLAFAGGIAGGGIGAAAGPLMQLAQEGRMSSAAFARSAPQSTAIGAVLGGLAGFAAARMASRVNADRRRAATAQFDQQEKAWAEREAEKKDALVSSLSPQP